MSARAKMQIVGEEIAAHLTEIAELFVPGTKLTLVARQPSHPDGSRDLVQTNDELPALIDALRIRAASSSSTPLSETPKNAQRQADAWNSSVPIGTSVDVVRDDGTVLRTRTRSVAWVICDHASVLVDGISGGYLLDRVSVAPLSETPSEENCEHCGNPLSLHPMRWERKSKPGTFLTCDAPVAPLSEPTSEGLND